MPSPIDLKTGLKQLFLDDYLIETMTGVRRTMNPARKEPRNPLIVPDFPGDEGNVVYGAALREGPRSWRLWYLDHAHETLPGVGSVGNYGTCVAESRDGLRWTKPALGLEGKNAPPNRIMGRRFHPQFCEWQGLLLDSEDPDPNRRYKAVYQTLPPGLGGVVFHPLRQYHTTFSADGVHWTQGAQIPTKAPVNPDIGHLTYDPVERKYVLWGRARYAPEDVAARAPEGWFFRAVSRLTSDDFDHWTDEGVVMTADMQDPPLGDIYSLAAFRCGATWVGLVQFYDQTRDRQVLEIQLACSRDGKRWTRLMERKPILPVGDIGEWDRYNQSIASNPLVVGDELWLYYGGRTQRHNALHGHGPDSGPAWAGIGLARWRLDGFVSLDASFDGGLIETKPLRLPAGRLRLNVKADHGRVTVQALALDGAPLAASLPVQTDSVRAAVKWSAPVKRGALESQPVRLRIKLENARLYALWVE